MTLHNEMKMVRDGLQRLKDLKGFEKKLDAPFNLMSKFISLSKHELGAKASRGIGNDIFTKSIHDVCIHYNVMHQYNRSIACAPLNSELLALAYGNRSALLEHIGKYKHSISAINVALSITKEPSLKVKLLCRKAKCEAALGLSDGNRILTDAKYWLDKIDSTGPTKRTLVDFMKKSEVFVKNRIQKPPSAEQDDEGISALISKAEIDSVNSVEMAYSKKHGRHLIAARDIKPGEIVILEKAFTSIIASPESIALYCWHCSSFLWEIVPCASCPYCCFCSEKCRAESWEQYHAVECGVLMIFDAAHLNLEPVCEVSKQATCQHGLRMLIIAMNQAGTLRNLRTTLESLDKCIDKEQINKNLPSGNYQDVYALTSYVPKTELNTLVDDVALYMVILAKFTPIFKEIFDPDIFSLKKLKNNDDILYMGALLLKFCMISDYRSLFNSRTPDCKKGKPCGVIIGHGEIRGEISLSLGVKTSSTCLSCIPNVKRCFIGNNQIMLYSIMPIKKGSQISDSHMSIFAPIPKLERQLEFKERHGFRCNCQACEENWPDIGIEGGIVKYYSEVASTSSKKIHAVIHEFFSVYIIQDLPRVEKISKFSKLIEDATKHSPLPSEITARLIEGLITYIENTYGFYKQQVPDECSNNY